MRNDIYGERFMQSDMRKVNIRIPYLEAISENASLPLDAHIHS